MERLTMRCLDGRACAKGERPGEAQPAVRILPELLERLAQYEDTGLTPEQIADQRWVPISERFPVQEYEKHRKVYGSDPEFIVVISGAAKSTVLLFHMDKDGKPYWHDGENIYPVSYWKNLPPSPWRGHHG